MPTTQSSLETLLGAAVEIGDPSQREAYLQRACDGDAARLAELQSMVHDYFAAGSLIDRPAVVIATVDYGERSFIGGRIGHYKLLEQIGEGGMGTVYMAEQKEPVRRTVALKVIKPGMDTRQVVARFEAERQALAMMNHPNIAKVLDAGATEAGRPYFVMELVKGTPITEFCDEQKLDTRRRLQLFVTLCQAVQHAHQKGLIHRDLKPSNVLVEMHDVRPVPKVIDFGVAKAIGQQLTEKTLHTGFSEMIGTPLYMSPEQAGQSSIDVDTRSDIYSLGVLLYEILTGTTPFDKDLLTKAGYDELRRIIREDEPPRPSARVSTLQAQALSTVSDRRQVEPRKLSRQLRGELDWIVMKALEKDRIRRYESASALAADVQRYLDDEPIEASPPSTFYRLRKLARRHKLALATASTVLLALILGAGISLWQAAQANAARSLADQRLQDLKQAFDALEREKASAASSYRTAREAVQQLLTRVADKRLGAVAGLKDIRRRLLEDAVAFYSKLIKLHPQDAQAYLERGETNGLLGNFAQARADYEKAVELAPENAHYQTTLGTFLVFCPDISIRRGAEAGLVFVKRAVELQPEVALHHYNLFSVLSVLGRREEATTALRKAADLDPESLFLQARVAQDSGDRAKGLAFLQKAIQQSPDDLQIYYLAVELMVSQGDAKGVVAICSQAIAAKPNDPNTRPFYIQRAEIYDREGNYEGALADCSKAIEVAPFSAPSYKHRGRLHFKFQRYSDWLDDLAKSVDLDPNDPDGIHEVAIFVQICSDESLHKRALEIIERALQSARDKAGVLVTRARTYAALGRFDEGLADLRRAQQQVPHRGGVEAWGVQFYIENAAKLTERNLWDQALADSERDVMLGNDYWKIRNRGELAWLLATSRDDNVRRPERALHFAKLAIESGPTDTVPTLSAYTQYNPDFYRRDVGSIDAVGVPHAYAARGWLAREDGRTEDAKADFAKAASSERAGPRFSWLYALMCLESGDLAAYQRASVKELRLLLHDPYRRRPGGGHWGVSICVLGPDAVADYSPVIAVAKQAADLNPGDRTVLCDLGAAYFRAGHFEEARQALSKSESAPETQGTSPTYIGYFLAMTNQRLGRREEAQSCLAKASSQTEKMLAESKDEAGKTLQWDRRVTLKLLDAEAKALLSGDNQQKSP